MSKPTFTLSRASLKDVPRIGEIAVRVFETDTHSQMKVMTKKPDEWRQGFEEGARNYIESQRVVMLKATDDRDGTVAGTLAWVFRGVEMDSSAGDSGDATAQEEQASKPGKEESAGATGDAAQDVAAEQAPVPGAEKVKELEKMTSDHLYGFMDRVLPVDGRGMFVAGCSVDPSYQGQGVGSLLMDQATEKADMFGLSIWVHSSEAGWPFYAKHGFKEVERLTLDLDEWAPGPPPKDGVFGDREKWGEYIFRYMAREPKSTGSGH
ncbi:hypothetical protein JX266_010511 [Neoarthrinium moseri]|nr:hypothetical protein JX266_010511 [Neoarthrinium moseri]